MSGAQLARQYQELKALAKRDLKNSDVSSKLSQNTRDAFAFVTSSCPRRPLVSMVSGKTYSSFSRGPKISRPVNDALFISDHLALDRKLPFAPESWRRFQQQR
jgi:hypothetical protein